MGHSSNGHFDLRALDDVHIDFSANDGTNGLFNAGQLDGNSVASGVYGSVVGSWRQRGPGATQRQRQR